MRFTASAVLRWSALLLIAGCTGSGGAHTPAAGSTPRASIVPVRVGDLDSLIQRDMEGKRFVGLSVGVAQDGKIVFAKGYGLAALQTRDSVTPTTMFGIGSVTKQFTCSSVLLLAEERKLSLTDPVSKYLPNLTRAADITLLDLGRHVSGYRDYYPLDFVDQEMQKAASADQIIDEYATRPLDFEPGTRWSYSNTGFLILGRVLEKVSGQPMETFLTQWIFTPLGMHHTRYQPASRTADMARGYTSFALADPMPAMPEAAGWAGSAGAIWSTPSDLLTWDLALMGGKVLSEDSYRTLTTPAHLADGRSTGYGCGEGVQDRGEAVVLSHGGAVSGFVARNTVLPATRSAVVLLANTDFATLAPIQDAILAKLVPHLDVPKINGPPALEAAKVFLAQLQQGKADRSSLGEDFAKFLTPQLLAMARASFAKLGAVRSVQVAQTYERGGMEVAVLRFDVGKTSAEGLMYRTPDGKIQEFLLSQR